MKENRSIKAELNSIASLDKKRKLQDELPEMPLAKKVEIDQFARGGESESESTDSNSFHFNSDSTMFTDDQTKSDLEYAETCSSDTPLTSSSSAGTSSEFSLYSSESRSSANSSSSEPELLSITEEPDHLHHQNEGQIGEFGSGSDFSLLEYGKGVIDQQCIDKELENLLYSNRVAPSSNYILSSGRWSVNQDSQQEGKKLTIDKEFEQYLSMLML